MIQNTHTVQVTFLGLTGNTSLALTNGIAGWMTSGDSGDVGQLRVAEEAPDDLR
jgi:hypothetical protein